MYLAARKDKKTNKMTKMFDIRVMCVNSGVVAFHAFHSMLFRRVNVTKNYKCKHCESFIVKLNLF
jgi:lipopolysaccharide biosynthesis regulator YciM